MGTIIVKIFILLIMTVRFKSCSLYFISIKTIVNTVNNNRHQYKISATKLSIKYILLFYNNIDN